MTALVATKTDGVVARLDAAARLLQEATTPQAMKQVLDVAHAALEYAKRQKLGEEVIQYANCVKVDAEWRLGKMITAGQDAGQVAKPGKPAKCSNKEHLSDLGIDRKTSSRAQKLAALPEDKVEAIKTGKTTITKALREKKAEEIRKQVSAPTAKYRVIYADPPWSYGNNQPDYHTEQRDHYPVMPLKDICDMPVADWCEPNAVLFLWVTSPILEESFQVIKAWGFKYKASFVWDKVKHNMGHYNSVRHELLLVCTRGSCVPDVQKLFDSVVSQERGRHSEKPAIFYDIIETIYTHGKKLEIFARSRRHGWDAHGHEAEASAA